MGFFIETTSFVFYRPSTNIFQMNYIKVMLFGELIRFDRWESINLLQGDSLVEALGILVTQCETISRCLDNFNQKAIRLMWYNNQNELESSDGFAVGVCGVMSGWVSICEVRLRMIGTAATAVAASP